MRPFRHRNAEAMRAVKDTTERTVSRILAAATEMEHECKHPPCQHAAGLRLAVHEVRDAAKCQECGAEPGSHAGDCSTWEADGPEPWWVQHPDHMKGWEAFGVTGQAPTVRRLGSGYQEKNEPGTTPFGNGEVKLGVAGVEFSTHADDPEGAYIYVVGTTREDTEARYYVAVDAFAHVQAMLWPSSRKVKVDV